MSGARIRRSILSCNGSAQGPSLAAFEETEQRLVVERVATGAAEVKHLRIVESSVHVGDLDEQQLNEGGLQGVNVYRSHRRVRIVHPVIRAASSSVTAFSCPRTLLRICCILSQLDRFLVFHPLFHLFHAFLEILALICGFLRVGPFQYLRAVLKSAELGLFPFQPILISRAAHLFRFHLCDVLFRFFDAALERTLLTDGYEQRTSHLRDDNGAVFHELRIVQWMASNVAEEARFEIFALIPDGTGVLEQAAEIVHLHPKRHAFVGWFDVPGSTRPV